MIHSNRTVLPGGIAEAFITIEQGTITAISERRPDGNEYLLTDIGNQLLMPGVIDPHVHVNEPGRTEWEGFNTASKAAIAGGITTIVDMPLNASPVTTTVKALEQKISAAQGRLHANVGFWGGIVPGNEEEVEGLVNRGVLGFKAFLTHSGIAEFPNVTEADLQKVMPIIATHGLPLLVHCELTDTIARSSGDIRSYQNYLNTRPAKWEDNAIEMMIRLCESYQCRVHIVHLSSAGSVDQLRQAKQNGLPVTVETAQHYLYFDAENIRDGETQFKCAPPIRSKENNGFLWDSLKEGVIDFVATDHSPSLPIMKNMEQGDFLTAWGGISSLQFALPVLWTAAKKHGCTIKDIAKWLCENPAKLIGKESSKGKIAIGYDADLVVWNEEQLFTVTENRIHHRHKLTPYLNEQLLGVVKMTYVGGTKVYDEEKFANVTAGKMILRGQQ